MCKHCERIKEDVESIPLIHAFFEDLTKKVNRTLKEEGKNFTVTANDLDIDVKVDYRPYCTITDDIRKRIFELIHNL